MCPHCGEYSEIVCFNRYMVECECVQACGSRWRSLVLIDTWWNVNHLSLRHRKKKINVLIDTWWNVNAADCSRCCWQASVLIDTWWNVNYNSSTGMPHASEF